MVTLKLHMYCREYLADFINGSNKATQRAMAIAALIALRHQHRIGKRSYRKLFMRFLALPDSIGAESSMKSIGSIIYMK